jgi:hypothetical protein
MPDQTDIDVLREQIAAIATELVSLQTATFVPQPVALQRLQDAITVLGAQWQPQGVHGVMLPRFSPMALRLMLEAPTEGALTAMLCALLPAQVTAYCTAQLDQLYAEGDRPVMAEGERQARLAELSSALLELEAQEEQTIRALESAGMDAPARRGDVTHLAVIVDD